ncbi:MAG: hypothetical protein WAL91_13390 [Propionicimonas sp.]
MTQPERHAESERGFGRDGISGLVTTSRALRARDVSRPGPAEVAAAQDAAAALLATLPPLTPRPAPGVIER